MATEYEITMTIKVEDVGNVKANPAALHNAVIDAVENITKKDVVKVEFCNIWEVN